MENPNKVYNTAVEATLEVIGGKWKPVTLFHLTFGKRRNSEFLSLIPQITQKMLTQQAPGFPGNCGRSPVGPYNQCCFCE